MVTLQLSWLRRMMAMGSLAAIVIFYAGVYCYLSRRGKTESTRYQLRGFLYVPIANAFAEQDLTTHYRLSTFFAPANWIDVHVFCGPRPIQSITFRLANEKND